MQSLRSVLFKIIGVAVGFIIAFGVAEMAVRIICPQEVAPVRFVYDPELGEIPTPSQTGRKILPGGYDHTYSNNSLGFRGSKEYSLEKQTGFRILFLGDSFTYGLGVNDDQTFPYQVEKSLLADNWSVEVVNAGNPGKGTDYELKFFQVVGYKFKPDLTVLCFVANDFEDNAQGEYYRVADNGAMAVRSLSGSRRAVKTVLLHFPGYNWLVSWSQAANLVKQAAVKFMVKARHSWGTSLPGTAGLVVSYAGTPNGYANDRNKKLTATYLDHLMRSVRNAGGSFMVFYIPLSTDLETYREKHQVSGDEAALRQIVEAHGEVLLSLTPVLSSSHEPMGKLFLARDCHWTPLAHSLAAQYMSAEINQRLRNIKDRGPNAPPR